MGETTPNLGLKKPFYREGRWDIPMNENSDILDVAVAGKEPAITPGTTEEYLRGDKTWVNFATGVRNTVLTGLNTGLTGLISAADTLLQALGKLQNQISSLTDNVLTLDNTDAYTPTLDYHPATKKYVDDSGGGGTSYWDRVASALVPSTVTDPIRVGDGTSGTPSYSFVSDTSAGMFIDVTGAVHLVSSGTTTSVKVGVSSVEIRILSVPTSIDLFGTTTTSIDTASISGGAGALSTSAAIKASVLTLDNTDAYTPTLDYHPATKKYVDDSGGGGTSYWDRTSGVLTPSTSTDVIRVGAGTVGAPGLSFGPEPDCGLYRSGTNAIGFSAAGGNKMTINSSGVTTPILDVTTLTLGSATVSGAIKLAAGTASAPSYAFTLEPDCGMYRSGTNAIGFSAAGGNKMTINSSGVTIPILDVTTLTLGSATVSGAIKLAAGTASAPSISFTLDTDCGMYRSGTNAIGFSAAGNNKMVINSSGVNTVGTYQADNLLGGATTLSCDASGNIIRTPSDEKLKKDIVGVEGCLKKILELEPIHFSWKSKEQFGEAREVGFAAGDVQKVIPEAVSDGGDYLSLNTTPIVSYLVGAVKELSARLEQIEKEAGIKAGPDNGKSSPEKGKKKSKDC